ncbi:hypothetical protein BGX21_008771 [Mortierella sp. AD011]|nr:hypothetical protein BGX20_011414 [Mortierella sp. AD010]KAF9397535.1 hypothetical protein BGX21_008771 [Mortierella sp. AD011]
MTSIDPLDLPEILSAVAAYLERNDVLRCIRVSVTWYKLLLPILWKDITITVSPAAYPKLHSLRIKPVLPIRQRGAFGEDLTEFIFINPSLVSLAVTGLHGHLDATLWRAVSQLPSLKTLELCQVGMRTVDDANAFWLACANLDYLRLLDAYFVERGISVFDIPIPDILFPMVTKLELKTPPRNPLDLMRRCPHLKGLSWQSKRDHPALEIFAHDLSQGAWPGLEKLSHFHYL